ncbi:MAG: COX15/CtaA family protein [Candidatus Protistobacter heckmanni]|nr:COX15/CtaA family protein [Candidatus Protistobacter heckmanni]
MQLSHFAQLAAIGLLVALMPLSYVWVRAGREPGARFRKLIWITVFLTLDLIMFGGFTRLTDSGLSCPDWPGCYGTASPVHAAGDIHAAQTAMPTGPVTMAKAWIEMLHRYFAMAIGVLIITLVALALARSRQARRQGAPGPSPWPATAVLGLVCLQGAFGAWTVTLKLQPAIVTTHLLLGMALFAALTWLGCLELDGAPARSAGPVSMPRSLRALALAALALLVVQIALGGWVSTNYAVLACADFPLCNGRLVPEMQFTEGFSLWRPLGMTAGGEHLQLPALVAIHWTHRVFAVLVALVIAALAWRAAKAAKDLHGLKPWLVWLAALLVLQLATGISNIVLQWPLLGAIAHNGGAALLLFTLLRLNFALHCAPNA